MATRPCGNPREACERGLPRFRGCGGVLYGWSGMRIEMVLGESAHWQDLEMESKTVAGPGGRFGSAILAVFRAGNPHKLC